ncbi:MAG: hypothetical protein Q7J54_07740 [Candidatus Woesearchaeota archaeon]|nr:hypothetical protein [Candidatus Woesearchaeota archaeon]
MNGKKKIPFTKSVPNTLIDTEVKKYESLHYIPLKNVIIVIGEYKRQQELEFDYVLAKDGKIITALTLSGEQKKLGHRLNLIRPLSNLELKCPSLYNCVETKTSNSILYERFPTIKFLEKVALTTNCELPGYVFNKTPIDFRLN